MIRNRSPYGARGETPFVYRCPNARQWKAILSDIPGTRAVESDGIGCTWDAAQIVGPMLGHSPRTIVERRAGLHEGRDRWLALGFKDAIASRPFQGPAVKYVASRDACVLGLALRGGKSAVALSAGTLRGAERFMVFCPPYLVPHWVAEAFKWLTIEGVPPRVVALEGRSGSRGAVYSPRSGQPDLPGKRRRIDDKAELLGTLNEPGPTVIVSGFDILVSQYKRTGAGEERHVPHLLGMGPTLQNVPVDMLVIDEPQLVAGHLATGSKPFTRGEIITRIYGRRSQAKMAVALSATPLGSGSPLKVWQTWRMILGSDSQGPLMGSTHWAFAARYAGGGKYPNLSGYGPPEVWREDGFTNRMEYKSRWAALTYFKTAEELSPDMPGVARHVLRIDGGSTKWKVPKSVTGHADARDLMLRAGRFKAKACVDEVIQALMSGKKVQVLARHREVRSLAAEHIERALAKARKAKPGPERETARSVRLWSVDGGTPADVRHAYARSFVEWGGPAAFVATYDSIKGGLSLRGVKEVHAIELHPRPDTWIQAEGRGRELGEDKLTAVIYVIAGSYDDKMAEAILPALERIAEIEGSTDAGDLREQLADETEKSLDDLFSLMAGSVSDAAI